MYYKGRKTTVLNGPDYFRTLIVYLREGEEGTYPSQRRVLWGRTNRHRQNCVLPLGTLGFQTDWANQDKGRQTFRTQLSFLSGKVSKERVVGGTVTSRDLGPVGLLSSLGSGGTSSGPHWPSRLGPPDRYREDVTRRLEYPYRRKEHLQIRATSRISSTETHSRGTRGLRFQVILRGTKCVSKADGRGPSASLVEAVFV